MSTKKMTARSLFMKKKSPGITVNYAFGFLLNIGIFGKPSTKVEH